jgi:tetratricopeptide (TPR) repeat protein
MLSMPCPTTPTTTSSPALAIASLVRAAERALLTGTPARAVTSFDHAARLLAARPEPGPLEAAAMWLRAADGASFLPDHDTIAAFAGQAGRIYAQRGDERGEARAKIFIGRSMRRSGRFTEAHDLITDALRVLETEPDLDTLEALDQLASIALFSGSDDADRLTAEALALGHILHVDDSRYARLLGGRGVCFDAAGERRLAAMYQREAAKLALASGDSVTVAEAYLNLANTLNVDRPAEAIEPSRRAHDILSQLGDRYSIGTAVANLAFAQLAVGDWDAAHDTLFDLPHPQVVEHDRLVVATQVMLLGLRGDVEAANALPARLDTFSTTNDDPQFRAMMLTSRAFAAAARDDRAEALRHALECLDLGHGVLPFGADDGRWTWPLAARTAHELGQFDVEVSLVEMCEQLPVAQPAPMQRAEAKLIRARLASVGHDADTDALFDAAISALREHSTPYHLAHGLLDHAQHLQRDGRDIEQLIDEARTIAETLGCQPLIDRSGRIANAGVAVNAG